MELDITVLTGCNSSLQGQRDFGVNVTWLGRSQTRRGGGVHVGRVELGHNYTVGPGRVCNA